MMMEASASASGMSVEKAVQEVMRMHKSLPARPGIEEVEAARSLIQNVEMEDALKLERIAQRNTAKRIPEELLRIVQEMQRTLIDLQSKEQKKEAQKVLDVESAHLLFDEMIQRASVCLKSSKSKTATTSSLATLDKTLPPPSPHSYEEPMKAKDDSYVNKPFKASALRLDRVGAKPPSRGDVPTAPPLVDSAVDHGEKMNLIKLASCIEVSVKKGARELILQGKLSDQVEWLPDSIGKLSTLIKLDLSENAITMLPAAIGGLSSLKTLDLHGNRLEELPEAIGDLLHLLHLDLRGNQLTALPASIDRLARLQELDLSSNGITALPETIGSLGSLQKLNIETNDLEEIPHAIGRCTCLKELRADYNHLKALPEAVGRIESLEILTLRYNNIRQLPTTMASLSRLRQLDVSFNELEAIPESLCFATTLVKMDVSNNFADLQALPRSIGNLEMLEELKSNNNQIRTLPDSFGMLTRLRVFNVDGNPLVVPPADVVHKGPQAVVAYMADLAGKRELKPQPTKHKKSWPNICFFSISNKRKRNLVDYTKA
ncbi:plant intracellular Ras-group-related LRR protein 4-like isoform X2 [Salvia miltiorrhiza]|uniref:plant intracellular Ras-group-related LRR protein 4-like isoform X2 n=1 Tax=Salvia miltiorrhiza TaxID=226208 RepID=UPI0025AC897B|nr:plant intracellular Ras-group-related LRR protein 4-like isoform X2 [Salvia miltiorrhiza]XP_057809352.1 plant intracellular Ras-group-related LRR protein 4-like isoform X2 [Salvia miltiorrhiza]